MSLDPRLLEVLACPEDHGELEYIPSESVLVNPRLSRSYPIRDDIPVLLIDESTTLSESELATLLAKK